MIPVRNRVIMTRVLGRVGCFTSTLLMLGSCAVGGRHTPDAVLERNFLQHESGFEALLADVKADTNLEMITTHELRYSGRRLSNITESSSFDGLGFSAARWEKYQRQLRQLGLVQVNRGEGAIEFRVDQVSLWNGDSYKGYEYDPVAPPSQQADLDSYRISDRDKDSVGGHRVSRPIKGHWYIMLVVSP